MVGLLAGRVAFVQYRLMLEFSLRDDTMMAQLTMKNVVLLTAVLILTYGLYVPKSWRRAALVVGPLALLAVRDPAGPLPAASRGDGVALARVADEHDPAALALRLRRDDPAHPGRRLGLRGPHDLPAAPAGRRGPAARPVSPPAADRRRRDGRGLPGRAPAPEAPLRRQADPAGRRGRPDGRWSGSSARSASPPRSRTRTPSRSTTTAGPRTGPTTTSWSTCRA